MQFGKWLSNGRLFIFVVLTTATILVLAWSSTYVRPFEAVKNSFKPSDAWILDRNGYPLESIRTQNSKRSLDWVEWRDVSPVFKDILVSVEDQRFYSHLGVDPLAMASSVWGRLRGKPLRGASTITMQLAGLINKEKGRRTLMSKVRQILQAFKYDFYWSKEEILEAYVNLVSLRGEIVGLRAATLGYFAKNPSGLLQEEAALLAAMIRAPNASPSLIGRRACSILKYSQCDSIKLLAEQIFSKPYNLQRSREVIPVLSKYFVESGWETSVVQTSIDQKIQQLALGALREQLRALKNQNVNDGAVLVLETKTGRVVAYAANAGAHESSAPQIDGIQMRRQAGSTIKPFVYATAFDWRLLKPNSLLEDSPADIPISQGRVYSPKNYDKKFRGLVSASEALASSMNVPAVRALKLVGESRVLDRLRSIGFTNLQDDEYYGPSLALGSIDVSLWELTQGYRKLGTSNEVFSSATRENIFNILSTPEYRRFTFGTDSVLSLHFPAAVKTGTSKDMRDNWCVGWTPNYTIGVWIGNFNGDPMWNVSGISGAAPIWRTLMMALHPNPIGTQGRFVEPALPLVKKSLSRFRYPVADMMIGLDPDIPTELQKLPIEIDNPQKDQHVFLNNKLLSKARETVLWPIRRGKYRVDLKSSRGQTLDSIKFEVR